MLKTSIGNSIKLRRKTLKVSQTELAELAGLSVNTLYKIEKGLANPTLETLSRIAEILGMKLKLEVVIK